MIEVKLPNLPSKINFLTLLEALLMLNAPSVRVEIDGRYKIELASLDIYYQDLLAEFPFTGGVKFANVELLLNMIYSGN